MGGCFHCVINQRVEFVLFWFVVANFCSVLNGGGVFLLFLSFLKYMSAFGISPVTPHYAQGPLHPLPPGQRLWCREHARSTPGALAA